jgi:hypothetical protein
LKRKQLVGSILIALCLGLATWLLWPRKTNHGDTSREKLAARSALRVAATPGFRSKEAGPQVHTTMTPAAMAAVPTVVATIHPTVRPSPATEGQSPPTTPQTSLADDAASTSASNPYPSPIQQHLRETAQRVRNLAAALDLDEDATRALTRIMVADVRGERGLWDEAQIYGDTQVNEQAAAQLRENTLQAIRSDPQLGAGIARVVQRVFNPLVRDPGNPPDPKQGGTIGISELRGLAGKQ